VETALVIAFRDSEPFDEVRREFNAETVARDVPFHVTLLYPFAPREELTDDVLAEARSFFAARRPLAFALTRIACWPEVVYAVPEPDAELRDCMQALHALFPQWPPYGGVYDTITPHATLAESVDVAKVYPEIEKRLRNHLPFRWTADAVTLLEEFAPDLWRERERMPFKATEAGA
jgi:2'-5' RNA ligase